MVMEVLPDPSLARGWHYFHFDLWPRPLGVAPLLGWVSAESSHINDTIFNHELSLARGAASLSLLPF